MTIVYLDCHARRHGLATISEYHYYLDTPLSRRRDVRAPPPRRRRTERTTRRVDHDGRRVVMDDVVIAGVGVHPFGRFDAGYRELGAHAAAEALADADAAFGEVDLALVANVGAEMAKGQN